VNSDLRHALESLSVTSGQALDKHVKLQARPATGPRLREPEPGVPPAKKGVQNYDSQK
jgi:hypothetical protein